MAQYTSLRCRMKVKPDYIPLITEMSEYGASWQDELSLYPQFTDLHTYASRNSNADFIPHGVLTGEPAQWEKDSEWVHSTFNPTTQEWSFQCSFVDRGVLEDFFTLVLPHIAEEVLHLEQVEEYENIGRFYKLDKANNKIVQSNRPFIYYNNL